MELIENFTKKETVINKSDEATCEQVTTIACFGIKEKNSMSRDNGLPNPSEGVSVWWILIKHYDFNIHIHHTHNTTRYHP